jgi:hypothetical protein
VGTPGRRSQVCHRNLCLSPTNPQTNTYQVILSTDGSRSYALFLYQSGAMQWDVTQRLHNSVIMGFSRWSESG